MLRVFTLSALSLFPLTAAAEQGVLVAHVPKGATTEVIARIVKQAFTGRRWTIDDSTDGTVSAHIERKALRARLSIEYSNGALMYTGDAQRLSSTGHPAIADARSSHWQSTSVPSSWVINLQGDISKMLATIPDR